LLAKLDGDDLEAESVILSTHLVLRGSA
jgi:hypothetical protein